MWDELTEWASTLAPEKWMVLGAAAAIALAATLFISSPALRRMARRWQLRKRVRSLGDELIENAHIPDGMGGSLRIDYLVRGEQGITVVTLRHYPGVIFAAENMELWVQMLGTGSHKFPNPLPGLRVQVAAVRALIPDVPVQGVLLFTHGSEFPKGKPAEVMTLEELGGHRRARREPGSWPELEHGWERLRLQNH